MLKEKGEPNMGTDKVPPEVTIPPRLRLQAFNRPGSFDHSLAIAFHLLPYLEPNEGLNSDKAIADRAMDLTWTVDGAHLWDLHDLMIVVCGNGAWHTPCYPYFEYEFAVTVRRQLPRGYKLNEEERKHWWIIGQNYPHFRNEVYALAKRLHFEVNTSELPAPIQVPTFPAPIPAPMFARYQTRLWTVWESAHASITALTGLLHH
jgi:hypothetical protein